MTTQSTMKIHPGLYVPLVLTNGLWWAVVFWTWLNAIYSPETYIQFTHLVFPCIIVSWAEIHRIFTPAFSWGNDP